MRRAISEWGASGLAAAIAAAQTGGPGAKVTLVEQNAAPGKKLLATGNGRCNFDNAASSDPARYFTAAPAALQKLLASIDGAGLSAWWQELGLVSRADETGRLYPYSNQAADLTGLLVRWLDALGVDRRAARVLELGQKGGRLCRPCGGGRPKAAADGRTGDLCAGRQRRAAVWDRRFWTRPGGPVRRPGRASVPLSDPSALRRPGPDAEAVRASSPGRRHPAGGWTAPGPGGRGDPVHQLRAVGHLCHAAVGAAGPRTGPKKSPLWHWTYSRL